MPTEWTLVDSCPRCANTHRCPIDCVIEEDYPGQHSERRRHEIIEEAVQAADRIIMDFSDGSIEETEYLTSAVASKFMEKVHGRIQSNLLRYDIHERHAKAQGKTPDSLSSQ